MIFAGSKEAVYFDDDENDHDGDGIPDDQDDYFNDADNDGIPDEFDDE